LLGTTLLVERLGQRDSFFFVPFVFFVFFVIAVGAFIFVRR